MSARQDTSKKPSNNGGEIELSPVLSDYSSTWKSTVTPVDSQGPEFRSKNEDSKKRTVRVGVRCIPKLVADMPKIRRESFQKFIWIRRNRFRRHEDLGERVDYIRPPGIRYLIESLKPDFTQNFRTLALMSIGLSEIEPDEDDGTGNGQNVRRSIIPNTKPHPDCPPLDPKVSTVRIMAEYMLTTMKESPQPRRGADGRPETLRPIYNPNAQPQKGPVPDVDSQACVRIWFHWIVLSCRRSSDLSDEETEVLDEVEAHMGPIRLGEGFICRTADEMVDIAAKLGKVMDRVANSREDEMPEQLRVCWALIYAMEEAGRANREYC